MSQSPEQKTAELHANAERGRQADILLSNPAMLAAFDSVRMSLLNGLAEAPSRDIEGIQLLQAQVKVLDKVHALLLDYVEAGKAADHDIQREIDSNRTLIQKLEDEAAGITARGIAKVRSFRGRY